MGELSSFKDFMAESMFGMTLSEALHQSVCVSCKENIDDLNHDPEEYRISGLCDLCFLIMTGGEKQ